MTAPARTDLVERDDALAALRAAAERAERSEGGTVLIHGEAGIGKTALVRAAFGGEVATRWRVLRGGCEALFSPRPLGPVHDMAGALSAGVRAALAQAGQRAELFAQLLDALRSSPQPTALIVEDVHWADAATLDVIKYLARRLDELRALLVLTYRDDELADTHPLRSVLGDLMGERVTRIPLFPLSEAGVAELARRLGSPRLDLYATTRGNPFFVTACAQGDGLPATVRDAVLARAARLGSTARAVLELVALVPARIETALVDALLEPAPEALAEAIASGLLLAQPQHLAFRHELARIAIEQAMAAPARAKWHARVLAHLEQQPSAQVPLARLVHHADAAGLAAAVQRLAPAAAAQAASLGAHREAAALYAAALAHADALPPRERAALFEHRAYQCYLTDQITEAIAARERALAIWRRLGDDEQVGHTLRWLSRLHWFAGHNAQAVPLAEQAIALLQRCSEGVELAWAMSNRSQLHMLADETPGAVEWGTRAIALADRLGDTPVLVHALNNVGAARWRAGDADGRPMLERSLRLALEHDLPEHVARAYVNLVSTAVTHQDYAVARDAIAKAQAYLAARDLDSWAHNLAAWECRLDLEQDRWPRAADTAMRTLNRPGSAAINRLPALVVLARLRLRRGDPGAMDLLAEAAILARATDRQRLAPVAAAQAEAAWLGHDGADLALAREVLSTAQAAHDARVVDELSLWLQLPGQSGTGSWKAHEPVAGSRRPDERVARCAQLGCRFERALALLLTDDEPAQHAALAEIDALGATATAARYRDVLRGKGVKGLTRGPRASTAAHPAGLTAREAQVLVLLAEGLTNAEIAQRLVRSAKTVDHHVSAILAKLGARSRAEASARAAELGWLKAGPRPTDPR